MKLMKCPLNGLRNLSEFLYGGEVVDMPNPADCADAEWTDYIFSRDNPCGVVREWWCHASSAYWFIAERNTATDEIVRTYPAGELYNKRVDF